MKHESINKCRNVLRHYQLQVNFVEDYGKLRKVYTDKGIFALKQAGSNLREGEQFIQTMARLTKQGFTKMIHPYQTYDGRYLVHNDNETYYLMPWLPNESAEERDIRYHKLFQELAHLHSISSQEIELKREKLQQYYNQLSVQWDNRKEDLEKYVAECEQKMYMSPFELYFCTFYNETSKALEFARSKLDEWHSLITQKDKVRFVTIHGKLSSKHFIYDKNGNGYFINLEKAREASPIYDLISFYLRACRTYPIRSLECYEWLTTYQQHFTLRGEELLLFYCYMAFPESIIRAVEQYRHHRSSQKEIKHVQALLAGYWQMKNIEQLLMKIMEAEQQKKMAAEQAAQANSGI